jgi:LPXTG-site transpeptidase (sortase) family protein
VGIALVCFVLYALYGTALLEGYAQRHLNPRTHLRLSSVNIGLDQLVLGGDSPGNLRKGPALAAGSSVPGSAGPIVIVGHRTAAGGPFRHLSALQAGASIVLRSPGGRAYTYVVEGSETTTPRGLIQQRPGAQMLYLVTATPAYQDGRRLVVIARLLAGTGAKPVSQTYRLPGLEGSPSDALGAALFLCLLGAGWAVRSRWRRRLPRWVLWGAWAPAALATYAASVLLLGSMSRVL